MANTYVNAFDLLGDDETDDVHVLCDRLEKKTVEEVPSSPRKSRKEYVVFAKESEQLEYEAAKVHVNGNGVINKTNPKQHRSNRHGDVVKDGTWQAVTKKGHVKQVENGQRKYRRVKKDELKETENVCDGNGASVVETALNSEGDAAGAAAVTVESSNGDEVVEKQTTEEVNDDVPKPEETPEERKEREREEQIRKEEEERLRIREEEEAEEAKKMTLAQYEKILLEKKQALNLPKAEAKRVVAADKELESMKLVSRKQENDEVSNTSEAKLKNSKSFEKKGLQPVAARLSELFRPASFRGSYGGERGRGRGTDRGNQGGLGRRNNDRPQRNNGPSSAMTRPAEVPTVTDDHQFPVLGSAPPKPVAEPSEPTTIPSLPNRSASGPNHFGPSSNHSGSRGTHSGSRGNRSGSRQNRSYTGNRSTAPAANGSSAATRSAPAAKSSARTEP